MNIQAVFDNVQDDLEAVEGVLHEEGADSRIPLLSSVGEHILAAGGKRFRPMLTILAVVSAEPRRARGSLWPHPWS